MRLKTLEEGLKQVSTFSNNSSVFCGSPKTEKSSNILSFLTSTGGLRKRSTSQPRGSTFSISSPLRQPKETAVGELKGANNLRKKDASGENLPRKSLWASRNKVVDSGEKENTEVQGNNNIHNNGTTVYGELRANGNDNGELPKDIANTNCEDLVSGFLYDRLQKEVISLRKFCEAKENDLSAKDQEIKVSLIALFLPLYIDEEHTHCS